LTINLVSGTLVLLPERIGPCLFATKTLRDSHLVAQEMQPCVFASPTSIHLSQSGETSLSKLNRREESGAIWM
jgi:hypothetical protein